MKIINYIKESYSELVQKVSWPTSKELTNSAVVVLVASIIIALVVWAMDRSCIIFDGGQSRTGIKCICTRSVEPGYPGNHYTQGAGGMVIQL